MGNMQSVPIESVIPYEFNNRNHNEEQINRIANSISSFGFNQPIVIDEQNIILVGHGRLAAAMKLGLKEVPVLKREGLTEEQKKAYRILDNKLQNDSTWNFDNLGLDLGFLEDNGFDLPAWGLDELQALLNPTEEETYEDDVPECENEETLIQVGDVVMLNEHMLICGDCRQTILTAEQFDLLITDPPYGVSYVGKTEDALTLENDDLSEQDLSELWNGCLSNIWPSLKDGAAIYAAAPAGPLKTVFVEGLRSRDALRQELVWVKDSMVLGRSDYHYKHEPILYGWKPGASHYFTPDRTRTSVLEHARPTASTEHPTMKPIALWAELIGNSTKKGARILDPFLGSGTTIIAADQLGRLASGIELDPKYCHVVIERFQQHCAKVGKGFRCTINGKPFTPSEL